jgi:hypothetical protein
MDELKTFHLVGALTEQIKQHISSRQQTLIDYMELILKFKLGFKNTTMSPQSGKNSEASYGMTALMDLANSSGSQLYVWLDYAALLPLLRDDLDDCERMGCEWALANTLVHEMTVSNFASSISFC